MSDYTRVYWILMADYDDLINQLARQHQGEVEAAKIELTLWTLVKGRSAPRRAPGATRWAWSWSSASTASCTGRRRSRRSSWRRCWSRRRRRSRTCCSLTAGSRQVRRRTDPTCEIVEGEPQTGTRSCRFGCVTYGEVLKLPDNTRVFLKEGRVGRIVSWHHTAEAVAVEVASERRIIRAQDLRIGTDGTVSEFPQDPAADPRANP